MLKNEEEMKYKELINTLHSLQKINAPSGFESDLLRKINSAPQKSKKSFFDPIFSPSRLIPAATAVAAVIILFVINPRAETPEDPLMTDPRVREDIISTEGVALNSQTESKVNAEIRRKDSSSNYQSGRYTASTSNKNLFINKSGLNFRQIRLSNDEREQLKQLKAKIKSLWNKPVQK